jgi:DNA-binding transcriptional ArsR family regulator
MRRALREVKYMKSTSLFSFLEPPAARARLPGMPPSVPPASWTFLTNHTHVLVCLARNEDITLREVAAQVGITERAVHAIVTALEQEGVLTRTREGQRNRYRLNRGYRLRHPLESHRKIGDLLDLIGSK